MPNADDFRNELHKMMDEALGQGKEYVDINAGELHGRLGGYPGPNHRLPNCCQVMKAMMSPEYGDSILQEPASGQGASLSIRYRVPRRESSPASGQTDQGNPDVTVAPSVPASPPTKRPYEITCKTEKDFWDHVKTAAEIIGIVLLAVYTGYTIKMYCANKKAADAAASAAVTAARQLELTERPWVSTGIAIDGPFDFNVNGANVHLKLLLQDTGPSPALNAVIEGRPVDTSFGDTLQVRDEACNAATSMIKRLPNFGIALFPNHPFEQSITWTFSKSELAKNHGAGSHQRDVIVWPSVVICIGYQPTFDQTKIYHTSYIVDLFKIDPSTKAPDVTFKIGEDVPKERLSLRLDNRGPIKAD